MRELWRRCSDERGIAIVVALFVMAILLATALFLVRMAGFEGSIGYGSVWSEGSFFAADAAINVALDQLSPTVTTATVAATTIGNFTYQGTVQFAGTIQQPGYSIGSGTGYNPGGFVFYNYPVTGQGTGPRNARRQIDAQASYGPVAQ